MIICLIQGRIAAFDPGSVGSWSLRIAEADLRKSSLSAHFEAKGPAVASFCVHRSIGTTMKSILVSWPTNEIIPDIEQVIVIFSGFCKTVFRGMIAPT
ncbi:hypothetical protein [uncultured Bosea sp.]|uniref:hypothetical protein n=1 Tax=uncultured Bosea sp. TaxID=211457 RepID=UPI00263A850A|nr:hypothetical protein [uncultured Bosea sp.]